MSMIHRAIHRLIQLFSRPLPFAGLLAAVSLIARSIFVTKADIWHDEGFSAMIINESVGDIIAKTINDVHPPFYYLVLHFWQSIFGSSVISLRGFSVACGIATVLLLYLLLRKITDEKVAKLGAFFAAIGPFLVRYSDEMRMYSLAALLAVAATYLLVTALQARSRKRWLWWTAYGLIVAAGMYTQYFFVLLVPVHVAYALYTHKWKLAHLLRDSGWWLGNLLAGGLFAIWLPSMIAQLSRVQQGFWIPPTSIESIPNTISYFMVYSNMLTPILGYTLIVALALSPLFLVKRERANAWLLVGWLIVPMLVVFLLSISRPVFLDRYFTYSAPAFYALLALAIMRVRLTKNWYRVAIITLVSAILLQGIATVGSVANHKMGHEASIVNNNFQENDVIVSAELYTYFDFSYYNKTGEPVLLLSSNPFGKYGEYSLLSEKPELRVADLHDISAPRVWLVGKTGEHDYYTTLIPTNWRLVHSSTAGDSALRLYEIHNE